MGLCVSVCASVFVCVSEGKRMMIHIRGRAYRKSLPHLTLLCKLKQTHTHTVNLRWASFKPVGKKEHWMSSLHEECLKKNKNKKTLFCTAFEIKLVSIAFIFSGGRGANHVPARPRSVYSVYCIRMWTHNYFLQNFEWLCSVSVECVCVCQPEQAFHYK